MVSNVTSGGAQLAHQLPLVGSSNGNQKDNPLGQAQKKQAAQPQQHAAPAPKVNTQGQRTGSVINTTA